MNRATHHRTLFLSLSVSFSPSWCSFVFSSSLNSHCCLHLPLFSLRSCLSAQFLLHSLFPSLLSFCPMPFFPPLPPISLTTCRSDCHRGNLMQKQYNQFPFSLLSFSFSLPHAKSADEKQFPCRMKTKMFARANKENNERQTEMIKCVCRLFTQNNLLNLISFKIETNRVQIAYICMWGVMACVCIVITTLSAYGLIHIGRSTKHTSYTFKRVKVSSFTKMNGGIRKKTIGE